jgi:hypothetical protein
METLFKVGDRVRHEKYGDGTIVFQFPNGDYTVEFDDSNPNLHNGFLLPSPKFKEDHCLFLSDRDLDPIGPITTTNEPSRAIIAAMAMQGLLANPEWAKTINTDDFDEFKDRVSNASVELADALIAELQKPKP